jgi:hypothetical protein
MVPVPNQPQVKAFNYTFFLDHLNLDSMHHRAFLAAVFAKLSEIDPEALSKNSDLHTLFISAVETKAPYLE